MNERGMRFWLVVFMLAVFCTGLGAGIVLDRLLARRPPGVTRMAPGLMGRGGRAGGPPPIERVAERLMADLRLSPDQHARVTAVLEAHRERLDAVRRDAQHKFETEQQAMRAEIRTLLTPAQQSQFDEWLKRWGPPPGGPEGPMGPGGGMGPGRGMGPGGRAGARRPAWRTPRP
jgi:hypothetical protein